MTRGRQPLRAIDEAYAIAKKRGQIMECPEKPDDRYHFVLFTEEYTHFIRIQRTRSQASDPAGVLQDYHREIRQLSKIPLTPVSAREFWVRSPKGSWQYFLIEKETVKELDAGGLLLSVTDRQSSGQESPAPASTLSRETDSGNAVPGD
ncbi:MAG: hypothetical protein WCX63_06595 [Methanoregula sp.]|jgi:hypothetical protein